MQILSSFGLQKTASGQCPIARANPLFTIIPFILDSRGKLTWYQGLRILHGEATTQAKEAAREDGWGSADDNHTNYGYDKKKLCPGRSVHFYQHGDHQKYTQHDSQRRKNADSSRHPKEKKI